MSNKLQGAYVQAWVWLSVDDFCGLPNLAGGHAKIKKAALAAAKVTWGVEDDVKIDDNAEVTLSYKREE